MTTSLVPRLKDQYNNQIRMKLKDDLGKSNIMEVPQITKIVVNMGVGEAVTRSSLLEGAISDLSVITGQKPMLTRAKKSIAGFKLREGNAIGAKVTLRGDRMYEFLDRLITATLPRVRDFKGISPKGFDGRGNYTLGIKEQIAFPEISIDRVNNITGMDITFVTNATSDEDARKLLTELGLPFKIKN